MVERRRAVCIGLISNWSTIRRRAASKMGRGHRCWTAEEDNLLRELITANVSGIIIRARLRRSREAIRMRRLKLQKREGKQTDELAPTPEPAGAPPVNKQ